MNNSNSATIFTLLNASVGADYLIYAYLSYPKKCGIEDYSELFSILAAFNMTDAFGKVHSMLMIRHSWGRANDYNQTWNAKDPNWTDALVAQVPFGVDPRKS